MMAPVAGPKWFVGKLSESIHIEHLSIVASEPFSSKPKSFMLSGRAAPIDDDSEAWRLLGVFEADEAVDAAGVGRGVSVWAWAARKSGTAHRVGVA